MKKIIDVPHGCNTITFSKTEYDPLSEEINNIISQKSVSDLLDYTEPLTADGLTLKEFCNETISITPEIERINNLNLLIVSKVQ